MKICLLLAALLLSVPSLLLAADRVVGLKEAIRTALERNNLVKAAQQERDAARHGLAAGRGRYLPRVYLDAGFSAANSPTRVFMMKLDQGRFSENDFLVGNLNHPAATTDFQTVLTMEQPIFDLSIVYGTRQAEIEETEREISLRLRREEVAFRVFTSFLETRKARAMLQVAEKGVQDAVEQLRVARSRSGAGTGLKSDELRASAFLAEMEQREISARNDLLLAGMRLALEAGGNDGEGFAAGEEVAGMGPVAGEAELVSLALANRGDLQELARESEKAEVAVGMAGAAFLPTLYADAKYRLNDRDTPFGRDNDAWMVGVNLRWELFDGFGRFQERARSKALRGAAREYLERRRKEVALQVRESLLRREEAAKRLESARASYRDAEEGTRLIRKRFENSLATMVELLDAQTALDRARASLVEIETDQAMATGRVWRSAGIFLKEVMK